MQNPASRLSPQLMLGVGSFAYLMAVANRTSLSALGPVAQQHFEIAATTLSMFAVMQLAVYAIMQVPVGLAIDRRGPTAVITAGLCALVAGQVIMAFSTWLPLVIGARVLVGIGDACVFTSVLRLASNWFSPKRFALLSQSIGMAGQLGQILSVIPLAQLVGLTSWGAGFASLAGVTLLALVLVVALLRDHGDDRTVVRAWRDRSARQAAGDDVDEVPVVTGSLPVIDVAHFDDRLGVRGIWHQIAGAFRVPGVRLALWVHFTTPFSNTLIMLLWGYPFLVFGVGMPAPLVQALFACASLASMVIGPAFGMITGRFARHRLRIAVGSVLFVMAAWAAVLLWPGTPPLWLVIVLMLSCVQGVTASMIAFEIARAHAPAGRLSTSTGLVNVGGFVAALIAIFLVGLILDLQHASTPDRFSMQAFRVAFASQYAIWVLGLGLIALDRRRVRRDVAARGFDPFAPES